MKGYNIGVANNIFAQAKADFRFDVFLDTLYWLSSEYSELNSWILRPVSGQFYYVGGKYSANQVRAAVAFKL